MKRFQGAARFRGTHRAPTHLAISLARCGCEKRGYIASSAKKMYDNHGSHLCEHTIKRPPSLDGAHGPAHTPAHIASTHIHTGVIWPEISPSGPSLACRPGLHWFHTETKKGEILWLHGVRHANPLTHMDAPSDPPQGETSRRPRADRSRRTCGA